jgi:hypothetical protein
LVSIAPAPASRVIYRFNYPFPPADVVEFFRRYYGPTTRAFVTRQEGDRTALRAELVDPWALDNQAGEPSRTLVDAEYLEVVGVRA